uniref:Uncharacterized protein n=1 Tax=Daphnia magna TaxID=35525 RepID=A0A0P6ILJ4_9CRUS
MDADFGETQVLIRLMVDYAYMAAKEHALLNRIEIATSEQEQRRKKSVFFWKNCPVEESYFHITVGRCLREDKILTFLQIKVHIWAPFFSVAPFPLDS